MRGITNNIPLKNNKMVLTRNNMAIFGVFGINHPRLFDNISNHPRFARVITEMLSNNLG